MKVAGQNEVKPAIRTPAVKEAVRRKKMLLPYEV
jgi:hypothetical protein